MQLENHMQTTPETTPTAEKLIRLPGVLGRIPVSRSSWYEGVKEGRFPPPIKIGKTALWRESDINRLIDSLTAE